MDFHNIDLKELNIQNHSTQIIGFIFLVIGRTLDWVINANLTLSIWELHIPEIITEIARTFAYLGAGVAFFKWIADLFKNKNNNKDKDDASK
jgi:hypothetical protein